MRTSIIRLTTTLFVAVGLCSAWNASSLAAEDEEEGESQCPDKSQYTLFNPTPANCLREFDPTAPTSPTVHLPWMQATFSLKSGLFSYALSRPDQQGVVTEEFDILDTNIRLGITNYAEIDLDVPPLNIVHTRFPISRFDTWKSGPGPLELQAKFNFFGNDSFEKPGSTALGLIPRLDIPTVIGGDHVEGGVAVPFAIKLSEKAELEMMTEYDFVHNDGGLWLPR